MWGYFSTKIWRCSGYGEWVKCLWKIKLSLFSYIYWGLTNFGLALYGKGNGEDSNIIQTLKMRAKYDTLFLIGLMKEKRKKFSS